MKNILRFIISGLLLILLISGCSNKTTKGIGEIPINYIQGANVINPDNSQEVVGFSDYVFLGYINNKTDTLYKDYVNIETDGGIKSVGLPLTQYSVTVIDNIKGNLKKNTAISIEKSGGIVKDGSMIILPEDDYLPDDGKYYILIGIGQPDGTLLLSGPNSNIELDIQTKSELFSSEEYKEYKKAYETEIKIDRKRFKSKYED